MLLFNLTPFLRSTLLRVSLRALFLVFSFSLSTLFLLAISLIALISRFTCMLMMLGSTYPFQALILLQLSHLYHILLILSTLGSLLIDFLLILIKLNTCSLEHNSSVQKLPILHFLSMAPHLSQFHLLATQVLSFSLIFLLTNIFPMSAVPAFVTSVNFAKSVLLLISIHQFNLQMHVFHPNLIIVIVFFYGLPDTSTKHLQRVQNYLARVNFPALKGSEHITPALVNLHWLPIHTNRKESSLIAL